MQAATRDEIEAAFGGWTDKEELFVPTLDEIDWDARDFLGWVHPGGHRGYLVHWSPVDGELKGTVLRRSRRGGKKPHVEMCAWCHHVHYSGGTAMFSVSLKGSHGRHIFGNVVCADLACSLRPRVRRLRRPPILRVGGFGSRRESGRARTTAGGGP